MTAVRPRLAFVSPVFLFPNDAGGKIRSTNILRGLKGGKFELVLVGPATPEQQTRWSHEIGQVCDQFIPWEPVVERARWRRAFDLLGSLPVNVANDRTAAGTAALQALAGRDDIDLVVFDFVHSAVLLPESMRCATVCFTHNVEAEIFGRHAEQAPDFVRRRLWRSQHAKMQRFEREALSAFTAVVAVSERDAKYFAEHYGVSRAHAIPTGVDLDFFAWNPPPAVTEATPPTVVFTGSMNWIANIDGVRFFLEQIWPHVIETVPAARFVVVGRDPPPALVAQARNHRNVQFTGFVDDVRPYVHAAHAFVIPLLVGGGTRIKAFEAMAMGCPLVSTSIGIEGLDVAPDRHYICRDDPASFAAAIVELLNDGALRNGISRRARQCVEEQFGHAVAAHVFEDICVEALVRSQGTVVVAEM